TSTSDSRTLTSAFFVRRAPPRSVVTATSFFVRRAMVWGRLRSVGLGVRAVADLDRRRALTALDDAAEGVVAVDARDQGLALVVVRRRIEDRELVAGLRLVLRRVDRDRQELPVEADVGHVALEVG